MQISSALTSLPQLLSYVSQPWFTFGSYCQNSAIPCTKLTTSTFIIYGITVNRKCDMSDNRSIFQRGLSYLFLITVIVKASSYQLDTTNCIQNISFRRPLAQQFWSITVHSILLSKNWPYLSIEKTQHYCHNNYEIGGVTQCNSAYFFIFIFNLFHAAKPKKKLYPIATYAYLTHALLFIMR